VSTKERSHHLFSTGRVRGREISDFDRNDWCHLKCRTVRSQLFLDELPDAAPSRWARVIDDTAEGERDAEMERLLSLDQAADYLGTTPRFSRRLVDERRIRFVRVGRHIRIPESALKEFIERGTVEPAPVRWRGVRETA
jgi:excisionase family DNA binding protein